MSLKTDSLVSYFPDVYAARDPDSVLYKFLSAYGAEFNESDKKILSLLGSHWVRYARGEALDQLGAMFNAARLRTRSGAPEPDKAYRERLESTVPMFIGGGTISAIQGAVRLALGLPYNLDQLHIPPQDAGMREDLEALVLVVEFSPRGDVVLGITVTTVEIDARGNMASQMVISLNATTVIEAVPLIEWRFQPGSGRNLSVELLKPGATTGEGFKSVEGFAVWQGETIVLTSEQDDILSAVLQGNEVAAEFTNLDGSSPAIMPRAPLQPSSWRFRAQGGLFDVSVFGSDTEVRDCFDTPDFQVQFSRVLYQPLTFDVIIPYFFDLAVEEIKRRYNYKGEILLYEGIGHQHVQGVVDQTRAQGVRGTVQFTLYFAEDQNQFDHLYQVEEPGSGNPTTAGAGP
ncbi:MAG TPA: hypothetical protein VKY85_05820 [Candidatus Angelobacter sp.]|nr:hypothetical protein [Candidatus Angelobacter sp.]